MNQLCALLPYIMFSVEVRQNPNTLVHIFIDEIPFSSFLDDLGAK